MIHPSHKSYPPLTKIKVIKTGETGLAIESLLGLITVKINGKDLIYPVKEIIFI